MFYFFRYFANAMALVAVAMLACHWNEISARAFVPMLHSEAEPKPDSETSREPAPLGALACEITRKICQEAVFTGDETKANNEDERRYPYRRANRSDNDDETERYEHRSELRQIAHDAPISVTAHYAIDKHPSSRH